MPDEILCPACLEDLNRASACESTKSGVVTEVIYGLKSDVAAWPEKLAANLRNGLVDHVETVKSPEPGSNLVMKEGKRLFYIVFKKETLELKYELQGESGARSFNATLEGNVPGMRSKILGLLAATKNEELVILAKTKAGEWHLLGDADEGVEYDSATATTGKAKADANGADLVLSYSCDAPTVYNGDIDSLLTVGGEPATITAADDPDVTGTGASATVKLEATVTPNDSVVTKVGFRYQKEGSTEWKNVNASLPSDFETPVTKTVTMSDGAGDYLYYAYMVVEGKEIYSNTYAFTVPGA